MNRLRIIGALLIVAFLGAFWKSRQDHDTATYYESKANGAELSMQLNPDAVDAQGVDEARELADSYQSASKAWGVTGIIFFVAGAVLLVGPTYLRLRREVRDPNAALARLAGTPRHGALAALGGAILGLIALDMPAHSSRMPNGSKMNAFVKELSIGPNVATVAGVAAAILAGYLILGQTRRPRKPVAYALGVLGAFLTANAIYVMFCDPFLEFEAGVPHRALGAYLNLLAAIALIAGPVATLRTLNDAPTLP